MCIEYRILEMIFFSRPFCVSCKCKSFIIWLFFFWEVGGVVRSIPYFFVTSQIENLNALTSVKNLLTVIFPCKVASEENKIRIVCLNLPISIKIQMYRFASVYNFFHRAPGGDHIAGTNVALYVRVRTVKISLDETK